MGVAVARAEAGAATFRPSDRLLRRADFQRCYREGRREHGSSAVLHAAAAPPTRAGAPPRLGITTSRRVGGAVLRNRLRRWVRETFRQSPTRARLAGLELVVHLRPEAAAMAFEQVTSDVERLFERIADRWESSSAGRR